MTLGRAAVAALLSTRLLAATTTAQDTRRGSAPASVTDSVGSVKVWANTNSGVYHCPGTRYYGNTKVGQFMPEGDALNRGFRPAYGHCCTPMPRDTRTESLNPTTRPDAAVNDSGPSHPVGATFACNVARIVDGDTVECTPAGRIRLIAIDAPELSQAPFGAEAAATLAAFILQGSDVLLEQDVEAHDKYGRLPAYVWRGVTLVNWRMIREGEAVLLTYPPNVQYVESFTDAQRRAREENRGLWAAGGFDCRPVDRRRGRCD
jgi:micrococcal nuclease